MYPTLNEPRQILPLIRRLSWQANWSEEKNIHQTRACIANGENEPSG